MQVFYEDLGILAENCDFGKGWGIIDTMRHSVEQENQEGFEWKIVRPEETGIENGWVSLQTVPIFLREKILYSEGFEQEQKEFLNKQYEECGYALHIGTEVISLSELGSGREGRVRRSFELVVLDLQGKEKQIWVNLFYNSSEYEFIAGDCHLPNEHIYNPFCVFRSYDDEKGIGSVLKQKPENATFLFSGRERAPLTVAYAN